jgi:hypothetical protein
MSDEELIDALAKAIATSIFDGVLPSPAIVVDYRTEAVSALAVIAPELEALRAENARLRAHISEMHSVIEWMVALIDGGEEMPKPGDEIHEALSLCVVNTKEFSARAEMGESDETQ